MDYAVLARSLRDAFVLYDREHHSYYSYYLVQGDEGALLVLQRVLQQLLDSYFGVAPLTDAGGKFGG